MKDPSIIVGNKELSGSVRDYPTKLPIVENRPNERFQSETFRRYAKPSYPWNYPIQSVEYIKPTGFTRGNRHEVTHDALTDEATVSLFINE